MTKKYCNICGAGIHNELIKETTLEGTQGGYEFTFSIELRRCNFNTTGFDCCAKCLHKAFLNGLNKYNTNIFSDAEQNHDQ